VALALPLRIVVSRPRLFISIAFGLLAYPILPRLLAHQNRALLAWDIGVAVYLLLSLQLFLTEDHRRVPYHAAAQEEGEWTIFAVMVSVAAASFVAIFNEFSASKSLPAELHNTHLAVVAATLLISWLMTHFTFAYRYAHEFYTSSPGTTGPDGGLDFPKEPNPDYMDFLYFSLVLGMTFQVSDVQITSRKLRRLAALHGLLSFLFNTVILALTVNLAAGLLQ
jgi:uncharacterized membrane protein